jgi:hypothetical protein
MEERRKPDDRPVSYCTHEPGDGYNGYVEAAGRLKTSRERLATYAALRATEKGRKAIRGFQE